MDGRALKRKWRSGQASLGMWLRLSDPTVPDLISELGFDWVVFDAEHVAYDLQPLQNLLMAFKGSDTVPIVRVHINEPAYIKRILDIGAGGVLVPQIGSTAEAAAAVAACKYPPTGMRGTGPRRPSRYGRQLADYLASANDQTIVLIMMETAGALNDLDQILNIDGLDGLVIGPVDLAMSLGCRGDSDQAAVQQAMSTIAAKARAAGMPFGTGRPADDQREWARRGATLLAIGDDEMFIHQGAVKALESFKRVVPGNEAGPAGTEQPDPARKGQP
jgi:2-keto-3-deoxy-L-rhamnonate aldolase RhmA